MRHVHIIGYGELLLWLAIFPVFLQFGFDPNSFFGGIASFFESLFTILLNAIIFLYNLLVEITIFLFNLIKFIGETLLAGFKFLGKILRPLYDVIIKKGVLRLFHWLLVLKQHLAAWFEPVLRFLRKIREWYDIFFKRFVEPILNSIQRIRAILHVFRILHLHFADGLDHWLARLEDKIIHNVLVLRQELNKISTILELLIDPELLLRRNPLIRSILRTIGDVFRGLRGLQDHPLDGKTLDAQAAERNIFHVKGEQGAAATGKFSDRAPDFADVTAKVEKELHDLLGLNV